MNLFLSRKDRQKRLAIIFLVLFMMGGGIAWYGYFGEGSIPFFRSKPAPPPRQVQINFDIFNDSLFGELGKRRPLIPFPGEVGKRNPFE